jgi:hypothetical protein
MTARAIRFRAALLAVIAEVLFLVGVFQAVRADAELSQAASDAENVFRIYGVDSSGSLSLRNHKATANDLETPDSLRLVIGAEATALGFPTTQQQPAVVVRVRVGTVVLYRDAAKGCWRLPPPFGSRCWLP